MVPYLSIITSTSPRELELATEYDTTINNQKVRAMETGESSVGRVQTTDTQRQEAYYLFFMATIGITLNVVVAIAIVLQKSLRHMTSAFILHGCLLNLVKAAYCVPFGVNLLQRRPLSDCNFEGSSYIVVVTTSAFNMVAMICAEAYTFGEENIGGRSRGSFCCAAFGVLMVYSSSIVLNLGPTLIGGYFRYYPQIGYCAFKLGEVTGYIASIMWIAVMVLSLVASCHFLCKLYKEIQRNQPNRVSMLVRSSITIMDDADAKRNSISKIRSVVKQANHRAKIFVVTMATFTLCWFPLFLLIMVDVHFNVSAKVYQAFSFIAWSQATMEPIIYICFDRQLNLLARWFYCDRYKRYRSPEIPDLVARGLSEKDITRNGHVRGATSDGSLDQLNTSHTTIDTLALETCPDDNDHREFKVSSEPRTMSKKDKWVSSKTNRPPQADTVSAGGSQPALTPVCHTDIDTDGGSSRHLSAPSRSNRTEIQC